MKRLFAVIFSVLAMLPVVGKNVKDVVLKSGGTLSKHLTQYELNNLDSIHISGYMLDQEDLYVLASMCEKGRLTGIDLSEIPILRDTIPDRAFMSRGINGVPSRRSESEPFRVNLRYIRLPKYIRKIGDMAFFGTNLVELDIPLTVDHIGERAFNDCKELRQVTVHSVSPTTMKADYPFDKDLKNTVLSVPVGSTSNFLSSAVWSSFGNVVEREGLYTTLHVKLDGKPLAELYGDALLQADSLVVTGQLAQSDFPTLRKAVNYGRLTGINLSGCVIEGNALPYNAFGFNGYTPELKNYRNLLYVSLPEGLESIGKEAFFSCKNLRCIEIPKTVKSIGTRAFLDCNRLGGTLTIPEGVTILPDSVFLDAWLLKEINLPSTLEKMGDFCLQLCARYIYDWKLTSVKVNRKTPPVMMDGRECMPFGRDECYEDDVKHCTLYVPVGAKAAYEASILWNRFPNIVETPELDGGTTGIAQTVAEPQQTEPSCIYTLDGRYVGNDIRQLGKGVYLVNGKKIIK